MKDQPRPWARDPHRLWTTKDVAERTTMCAETVRRMHKSGRLPAVPGLRKLFFTTETIEKFLLGKRR